MAYIMEHDIADVDYNGFESDLRAAQIIERLESAMRYSPTSCSDWLPASVNTNATCIAWLASDLGFVMRSRPNFDAQAARDYYRLSLEHDPSHCGSLSYLTELELQENNRDAAISAASAACTTCGMSLDVLYLTQSFERKGWPLPSACYVSLPRFVLPMFASTRFESASETTTAMISSGATTSVMAARANAVARLSPFTVVGVLISSYVWAFQLL